MAILDIIEVPHPILARRAREVEPNELGSELVVLLRDMAETMYAAPGVGLAAPQVSDSRRILVVDPGSDGDHEETKEGRELYKMVNPRIVERSQETVVWEESCLSVPDMVVEMTRNVRVKVVWQDAEGNSQEKEFSDFPAIVVQHEMDHLEGTTLLDRTSRLKRSRYLKRQKKLQRG